MADSDIRHGDVLVAERRPCARSRRLAFTIALGGFLIWTLPKTAAADARITDDHGGNIGAYWSRYMALKDAGEHIIIDGIWCLVLCRMIEFVLLPMRCSVFMLRGALVSLASRSSMIPRHVRFGTSIPLPFASGLAAMAASAWRLFIFLVLSSLVCTDDAAEPSLMCAC